MKTIRLSQWLANQKKLPEVINGNIIEETTKAIKLEYYTLTTVWLPKSQIQIEEKEEEK